MSLLILEIPLQRLYFSTPCSSIKTKGSFALTSAKKELLCQVSILIINCTLVMSTPLCFIFYPSSAWSIYSFFQVRVHFPPKVITIQQRIMHCSIVSYIQKSPLPIEVHKTPLLLLYQSTMLKTAYPYINLQAKAQLHASFV